MRRFLKKRFRVTVLAVLLLLMSSYAAYRVMLNPRLVNQKAQRVLSEMLGVQVEVYGASFQPLSGLTIDRVVVPVDYQGRHQDLARLEGIHVSHYLASMFSGRLNIREIRANSLTLSLARSADGSWNLEPVLATLRSRPVTQALLPVVTVDNVRIAYHDELTLDRQGHPFDVEIRGLHAAMNPRVGQHILDLTLAVDDPDLGRWQVRDAAVDVDHGTISLAAESSRLPINEALADRLGARGKEILNAYGPPEGGDAKFILFMSYQWASPSPLQFRLEADIQNTAITSVHFPYRLDEVKGTILLTPEGVHVERVTGTSEGSLFTISGDFIGYSGDAGVDLRVHAERLPLDPKLRAALSEDRRLIYDGFAPSGMLDVNARIKRDFGPDRSTSVSIEAHNSASGSRPVQVVYAPFPYPMTLTGSGTYVDGHVKIDPAKPVLAAHGGNVFAISGSIDPGEPYSLMNLTFRGKGISFEPGLYKAMPEEHRRLWDYLHPEGKVGATIVVKREHPDVELSDIDVTISELNAVFNCRDFPYAIQTDGGSMAYHRAARPEPSQTIVLDGLAGHHGKTAIKVNGELVGFGPDKAASLIDLTVSASGLPLDDDLKKAVPESVSWMWEVLRPDPAGLVNADCTFKRTDPANQGLEYHIQLRALDVALNCTSFPYPLKHLVGLVDFYQPESKGPSAEGQITITRLFGKGDTGAVVEVNGSLKGFTRGKAPDHVDISIAAADVPLDDSLRAALSPAYGKTFDALSPSGKVNVSCQIDRDASVADKLNTHIVVTARGNRIRYEKFPIPLTEVTGRIEILEDKLRLDGLSGKALGGDVTLSGSIEHTDASAEYDLKLHARDIALNDKLLPVVPEKYRALLARLDPLGRADIQMSLARKGATPADSVIRYSATVGLRETSLLLDAPDVPLGPAAPAPKDAAPPRRLTNIEGVLDIAGASGPDLDELTGRLNLATVQLNKFVLTDVVMRFDRARDRWQVYDLDGRLFGGRITGQIQVKRGDWTGFGSVFYLTDLDLARVGAELFKMQPGQVGGKLSGSLELQGTHLAMKDLVGRADLSVTDGKLWELPVILALLNVLNIPPMDRTAFTEARAVVELYDSRFHIRRIDLLGSTVSIYGKGEIASNGDVDLSFLTGISRLTVPGIPVIGDILKAAQKQLMLVTVRGTVSDPKLDVEPVAPVTNTVKSLLADIFGAPKPAVPKSAEGATP